MEPEEPRKDSWEEDLFRTNPALGEPALSSKRKKRFAGYCAIGLGFFSLWFFYGGEWGFGIGLCLAAYPQSLYARGADRREVGMMLIAALVAAIFFGALDGSPLTIIWVIWLVSWIYKVSTTDGWPELPVK